MSLTASKGQTCWFGLAGPSAPPPTVCDRNRHKDWLAAAAPAERSAAVVTQSLKFMVGLVVKKGGGFLMASDITYQCSIHKLWLDEVIVLENIFPDINKVEISIEENQNSKINKMFIRFYMQNVKNLVEAETLLKQPLNYIVDLISFKFNTSIGNPYLINANIPGQAIGISQINASLTVKRSLTEKQIQEFKNELTSKIVESSYLPLFKAAMQNTEPVSRFMFLYSILSLALEDLNQKDTVSQQEIDSFIKQSAYWDSKKDRPTANPRKNGAMETIYTWLRNQVGHTKNNSDLTEVTAEIESEVENLCEIVKLAIRAIP
ncbi:methylamine utilization protein MauJ [Brevibacillus sp. 1238]|uniref:methylamine utilization protein MauJ n=1 Tax=Brevibacillus sp. 1238 TaxID=2940565 RepID=UPI0024736E17|nr:methylamine utilization protein MauJ [Brevibacillus sp. 1238]MDH6351909.1 hypothetical protein [Brevibacillus sp. 1238]